MRLFLIKLLYVICSPITSLFMKVNGVKTKGIVFTSGFPYLFRGNGSEISFGKKVRMLNLPWMNSIGLMHRCIITTEKDAKLVIGDNVGMSGASIWCFKKITIGDNVRVGANVTIIDGDAHQDDPRSGKNKPVVIEDNVWIGANVTVLKGVTIGKNSLVGAGSVVTKDIPANVVAAGNPCIVVKYFDEDKIKDIEQYFK